MFYQTYVAAALDAYNKQLISIDELKSIAVKAMDEFALLDFAKLSDEKELRRRELVDDIRLVEELIV